MRHPVLALDPHPDSVQEGQWAAWARRQPGPLAVDLFCGGGGLSLGLQRAGFRVVLGVDTDLRSLETHRHNFGGASLAVDLAHESGVDRLVGLLSRVDVSLVAGGPPCQPFSRAGLSKLRSLVRDGTRGRVDPRRELWESFVQVVERVRPEAALMENVPDMALGDDLSVVRRIAQRLQRAGYSVDYQLLDAWRYGVPQHRQRFILVAVQRDRQFSWPRGDTSRVILDEAIGDLPTLGGGTGARTLPYVSVPRPGFQARAREEMRFGPPVVWDHITRPVRDDDLEAFGRMTGSTKYTDLPGDLRRYRADIFDDKYKRLDPDGLSRSITAHIAKDGYWYIHPTEHRTLTVREAARIQTFPDSYRFAGSRSDAFRQIGNAVPPALAEAVGRALHAAVTAAGPPGGEPMEPGQPDFAAVRDLLRRWAVGDRRHSPWRYSKDPWTVLVWSLLNGESGRGRPSAAQFLTWFPTPGQLGHDGLRVASLLAEGARARGAVERLGRAAAVLGSSRGAWHGSAWAKVAGVSMIDEARVRSLGLGEDRLVPSVATLRVVARLTGSRVHDERRFSDGKLALARVVGAGRSVPLLNATIESLGSSVCTAPRPRCGACPLRAVCRTAAAGNRL